MADQHAGMPLEITNLSKQFGTVKAVDDLTFTVSPGRVTGFLGPNGAGKTTTLRILLGLAQATSGTATIGGKRYQDLERPTGIVGASLEATFHPGRTARDHLRLLTPHLELPDSRADEVLDLVGLTPAAKRRAGGFSLGMRQRLALAATLLGDPSVLLLDEPANGLDPEGITWLRTFLRGLAAEGRTVLVSSHMLTEMQLTVDDIVIIHHGKLVHASPLSELAELAIPHVLVNGPNPDALTKSLRDRGWQVGEPEAAGGPYMISKAASDRNDGENVKAMASEIGHALFNDGVEVHQLTLKETPLEAIFMSLIEQRNGGVTS